MTNLPPAARGQSTGAAPPLIRLRFTTPAARIYNEA